MWYLIVPPIIVVFCLSFVLWYLSRKRSDPVVALKAEQLLRSEQSVFLSRARACLLGMLEKQAQRFRIRLLKMHNALHGWTQSMREKRLVFQESITAKKTPPEEEQKNKTRFFERFTRKKFVHDDHIEMLAEQPEMMNEKNDADADLKKTIERKRRRIEPSKRERIVTEADGEAVFRPTISDTLTQPDGTQRQRVKAGVSREETLIGKIALNPKDFAAYEELGDHYLEMGNIKDAKECYRQVLKLSPVHRMVKIKIRRLEKMLTQKA